MIARASGLSISKERNKDNVVLLRVQPPPWVLRSGYEPLVAAGDVAAIPCWVEDGGICGGAKGAVGEVGVWDDCAGEEGEVAEAVGEEGGVSLLGRSRGGSHGGDGRGDMGCETIPIQGKGGKGQTQQQLQ